LFRVLGFQNYLNLNLKTKIKQMSKLLHLIFCCCFISALSAQTPVCVANALYKDSTAGVYPLPFDAALNPKGGIPKPACIGKPYEFVFTIKVSDTIRYLGQSFALDSVKLETMGAITGLPAGITYACNPPNCNFVKKTTGCAVLKGTTTALANDYDLVINAKAYLAGAAGAFGGLDVSFPGAISAGKYTLKVVAATNAACTTSAIFGVDEIATMSAAPNPASLSTIINIESAQTGTYDFAVYNLMGQSVFSTPLSIQAGTNSLKLSTEDYPNGVYIYKLSKDSKQLSSKFVVNK
jgi:Secretion system C-terminal sorting domain